MSFTDSNPFTVQIVAAGAPAWFTSLADKTWATPLSNWIGAPAVIDPLATQNGGQKNAITDFTGLGYDQTNKIIFAAGNGGHGEYFGNECYAVDLKQASPAWQRLRNADVAGSSSGGNLGPGEYTQWSNGQPCSDHTGYIQLEAGGRWFKCGMGGTNYNGNQHNSWWWEYDRVHNTYVLLGTGFNAVSGTAGASPFYDSVTQSIYCCQSSPGSQPPCVQRVSFPGFTVTGSNTHNFPGPGGGIYAGFDSTNRVVIVKDDAFSNTFYWLTIGNLLTSPWNTITATGSGIGGTQGYQWHAPSNAFLAWDRNTTNIKKLTPTYSGGNLTALTWSTVACAGTTPVFDTSGFLYNRAGLINDMGNGQSAMIVSASYANPDFYILKLPVGGV